MDKLKRDIEKLITEIISVCECWIKNGDDGLSYFIDPNDEEEISAHYGATHAAASLILWGKIKQDESIYNKGVLLLESILTRWEVNKTQPAFHYDFNNFALTLVVDLVNSKLAKKIKYSILNTNDSNHDTVNWLPMRWFVCLKRYKWTGDKKYNDIIVRCKRLIAEASNADGGVEDRLPKGTSFNLQYDLATVSVMQYLKIQGESIDLSKELGFLLNAVAPDGDINYQGRGTNQVFAWGLWVYLLASSSQIPELQVAISFLQKRLSSMLNHNNMMLNDWDGQEKYFWWDYHYTSVYTAHCLLWLILAYRDFNKTDIQPVKPTSNETGLHIYRSEYAFVSWFEGRNEYLAEKGPSIAAIWTKKDGMLVKGTFGPWQGAFGNKYIFEDVIIKNYCGLIEVKKNKDWSKNVFIHKLLPFIKSENYVTLKPLFSPISITETDETLTIDWNLIDKDNVILNFPAIVNKADFSSKINGITTPLTCVEAIRNQYGWIWVQQTRVQNGTNFQLIIKK